MNIRNKLSKKFVSCLIALIVLLAIVLSNPGAFVLAKAASLPNSEPQHENGGTLFDNIHIQSSVVLGGDFEVPSVKNLHTLLLAPSGEVIIDNQATGDGLDFITAKEIGHYQLSYFNNDNANFFRDFYIRSYLKDELYLEVQNNGADIPEYAPSGATITLPRATIVQYDDYGNRINLLNLNKDTHDNYYDLTNTNEAGKVKVSVIGGGSDEDVPVTINDGVATFATKADMNTSYFVTYSFVSLDGDIITPLLSQSFRVRTQIGFERDAQDIPTLTVNSPARESNLNEKITLDVAKVEDKFQQNARVEVVVTTPSKKVVQVATVDPKTGWAIGEPDPNAPEVLFDNTTKNMFFYPTEKGDYTITYRAYTPSFVSSRPENASLQHRFVVRAIDRLAPTISEIDDFRVPSKWGATVSKRAVNPDGSYQGSETDPNPTDPLPDTTLYFPGFKQPNYPENYQVDSIKIADNVSSFEKLKVEVRLDNPQGKAVWRFDNIIDPNGSNQGEEINSTLGVYEKDSKFYEGFSFSKYNAFLKKSNVIFEGDYSLVYRIIDEAGQVATKTYRISITSDFSDTTVPIVTMPQDIDQHIVANSDLVWEIPNPTVSSQNDVRPEIEYNLIDGDGDIYPIQFSQDGDTRTVKDRLVGIRNESGVVDVYLTEFTKEDQILDTIGNGSMAISLGNDDFSNLRLEVQATNSVGNKSTTDTIGNIWNQTVGPVAKDITVVKESYNSSSKLNITDLHLDNNNGAHWVQGEEVNLGGTTLVQNLTEMEKNFVGFEINVRVPDFDASNGTDPGVVAGQPLSNVSIDTWYEKNGDGTYNLQIDNISFVPPVDGMYLLTIRLFDVNGNNSVYTNYIQIDPNSNVGGPGGTGRNVVGGNRGSRSSVNNVPKDTTVFKSYRLPTWTEIDQDSNPKSHLRRRIVGGSFELMGDLFTPKTEAVYSFDNKWFTEYGATDWNNGQALQGGKFESSASSSEQPTFSIVGDRDFAQYLEQSTDIEDSYVLPTVVASNDKQNFVVSKPVITDRLGRQVTVTHTDNLTGYTGHYEGWSFIPSQDGKYTIVYTAKLGSLSATQTYTIMVGRIEAPYIGLQVGQDKKDSKDSRKTGTVQSRSYDYEFYFDVIRIIGIDDEYTAPNDTDAKVYTFSKVLKAPDGSEVTTITDRWAIGNGVKLNQSGTWTVTYTVTDNAGNDTKIIDTITVSAPSDNNVFSLATISTILIILGIVLIVGAFVYLLLFRRVRVNPTHDNK
ncbi:MAG: hypothetical protein FWF56_04920 [Firmicutes bacterium]|nr:hypothetical protein [Bacillota bacterium]MCL1953888.1 hypothetical protein [Bacillota bacterium]